jgi:hypothetical protein
MPTAEHRGCARSYGHSGKMEAARGTAGFVAPDGSGPARRIIFAASVAIDGCAAMSHALRLAACGMRATW